MPQPTTVHSWLVCAAALGALAAAPSLARGQGLPRPCAPITEPEREEACAVAANRPEPGEDGGPGNGACPQWCDQASLPLGPEPAGDEDQGDGVVVVPAPAATTGRCSFSTATWYVIMFPDLVAGSKCRDINGLDAPPDYAASRSSVALADACLLEEAKACSRRGGAFTIRYGPTKPYANNFVSGANLGPIGLRCNGWVDVDSGWHCTQ